MLVDVILVIGAFDLVFLMRTSDESGLQFQEVQQGSKTLHLILQKSQAWSHMKHFGGSEEQW